MSNDPSPDPRCPKCGARMAQNTAEGLCPACLLALNLATQTELSEECGPNGTKKLRVHPQSPPAPSEIASEFPQFEILDCLGRGGMGVVYKARQKSLDRLVALKILAPERERDPQFAERFVREAKTLAHLSHPSIVTVHDFGETNGMFYLVMEFVDGVNLRHLLKERKLSPEQALAIVPPVCEALQYAHSRGVIHRDIKPENLLLDTQGRIKIADFGIAKILGRSVSPQSAQFPEGTSGHAHAARDPTSPSETSGITQEQVIGTPEYMAPEQTTSPQKVDHRADIYSLGVVLYEMLTGELPAPTLLPPSRKVQVDVRLDEIVLRALEKEPERRYQTATQFKTMVETMTTGAAKAKISLENAEGAGRPLPSATAHERYSPWETTIVLVGTLFFVVMSSFAWEYSGPLRMPLVVMGVLGLGICALSIAGVWPFRSPLFPEPNFSSRNLWRLRAFARPQPDTGPHLSRMAIAGATWIGLFFLNWIVSYTPAGWAVTRFFRDSPLRLAAELLVFLPLTVLGFAAIVGGSVMGGAALRQIRRASVAVRGFGLAVFDLLFFPLLLLNGWAGWLLWRMLTQMGWLGSLGDDHPGTHWVVLWMVLLVGVAFNGLLIRTVVRAATRFVQTPAPPAPPRRSGTWGQVFRRATMRLLVVVVLQLALFETLEQVSVHWKESTSELWGMALAVASLGGLLWACWPGYRLKQSWLFWVGGTTVSSLALLGLDNFYSWHLRPNLGLYRESDWVAQHPGFQKQLRERIQRNLWHDRSSGPITGADVTAFGPVIEKTIYDPDLREGNEALDLDTGQSLSYPDNFENGDLFSWLAEHGADLVAGRRDGWAIGTAETNELKLVLLPEADWDNATVAQLSAALESDPNGILARESKRREPAKVFYLDANPRFPYTFGFQTKQGGQGLLQIKGFTDDRHGLEVRYKRIGDHAG